MHYQKALMEDAGFATLPGTWPEFLKAAIALNKPPERYGFGIFGRQGAAIFVGFVPWLYSNGGQLLDFKTGEIFINNAKGVELLQFYADLATKYKVVPPESMTWEFDEIVAGGQADRYAMVQMFAPYGTLINDPKLSKTGGKWAWSTVPGPQSPDQGRTWIDGHIAGGAEIHQEQGVGDGIHRHVLQQGMAEARDDSRQRAAAQFDPYRSGDGGEDRLAANRGEGHRDRLSDAGQSRCGTRAKSSCAPALSQALLGQKTPKEALDAVAADWQRSLRRAGIGRG